ncbi:hypothetical protein [Piscibacillus salipiscarius]|uniref:Uncharacterized protein n=1 Tax=Piscibacillus salipiscarius TaxID=299480 RepID=A0ABW5Q9S8_9BACI|nr:hypothetical protein [Piscibacillus salipiscarius]
MFKSEKSIRRLYLFLMIFTYGIYIPVTLVELINGTASNASLITAVVLATGVPTMRKRHLESIKNKEYNSNV